MTKEHVKGVEYAPGELGERQDPHRRVLEGDLIARVRAALKLISPDHITPMGVRVIEKVLDAARGREAISFEDVKHKSNAKHGWTYKEVAAELQVSTTMVGNYVMGHRYPGLAVMRRVDRVYGWPLMEQIGCIPDLGRDNRYAEQLRYWLGAR